MGAYKLRVKIADHEFEAEGDEEVVKQQFQEFKALINESQSKFSKPTDREIKQNGQVFPPDLGQAIQLEKIVRYDEKTRRVSLTALPQGDDREADAVLLLLLAAKQFRNEDDILVTVLKDALQQSGCPIERMDRVMDKYEKHNLVLRSGLTKGGRYRLTNQGLMKAGEIAKQLLTLVA